MRSLALIGKKRSGKTTAADHLVNAFRYSPVAFASELKRKLIDLDPFVPTVPGVTVRLSALIADVGWEYAKDHYPEVRRLLQEYGSACRELDEDFWIRPVLRLVTGAQSWNIPVVVSDVRYPNEARALKLNGLVLVRIVRPGLDDSDTHPSETEQDKITADAVIYNDGDIPSLLAQVEALARP